MCGFVGMFAHEGRLDPRLAAALKPMNDALRHRGPDGDGFHADDVAGLGHRRLAIIDRAGGHQPMANEDETVWIAFNGEVYNHKALRTELQARGHRFRTSSDTEAIVHAYEEYGEACVDRLEGMFAFAIYDQRRRQLFAARDRLGKKPLFYASLGGALHLASEIKAFYRSPAWHGDLNLDALERYLSLGYFLAPETAFRSVFKLPPGHSLLARDGRVTIRQYWDVQEFDTDLRDTPDVMDSLSDTLRERVRERLESEVPLGAFLSGGIDSGLVVSYMTETMSNAPVTTSVGFGDKAHNELQAAAVTAGALRTNHHAHLVEPALEEILDRVVGAFDEPFADSSAIPTYYVSKAAREHVTVALTGDGGDEAFGGYDFRYTPHEYEARARRWMPAMVRRPLAALGASVWPRTRSLPQSLRLGTVFDNLRYEPRDAYYADLCYVKPATVRALLGAPTSSDPRTSPVYDAVTQPYDRCPSPSAVMKAQYADLKVYLPNDVLVKVDRMSMQHSLEIRCPLLDRRIVEFAFRSPTARKLPQLKPKYLLRTLAGQRLPAELSTLPKRGFTAPIGSWLRHGYRDAFTSEVLAADAKVAGLLDRRAIERLFNAHQSGTADASTALWSVWMLERWLRLVSVNPS